MTGKGDNPKYPKQKTHYFIACVFVSSTSYVVPLPPHCCRTKSKIHLIWKSQQQFERYIVSLNPFSPGHTSGTPGTHERTMEILNNKKCPKCDKYIHIVSLNPFWTRTYTYCTPGTKDGNPIATTTKSQSDRIHVSKVYFPTFTMKNHLNLCEIYHRWLG